MYIISYILISAFLVLVACGGGGSGQQPIPPANGTYTIGGIIRASESAVIDSDVNDPAATYSPNDTLDDAQPIPNPATLGGYVNLPGTGVPGRSRNNGDPEDYFIVSLADSQSINLFIANHPDADLDLYLYDSARNLVDASASDDSRESLTITAGDGIYYIRIVAVGAASNYNLTVGQSAMVNAENPLRLSDEFVPGEVIVHFEEEHHALRGFTTADGLAAAMGMQRRAGSSDRAMLMGINPDTDRRTVFQTLGIAPHSEADRGGRTVDRAIRQKLDTLTIVKALRRRPEIRSADLNYIRRMNIVPNDPDYGRQWHYPLINLPQAWVITIGGNDVIVAVIDTGVLLDHPDLAGRLTDGYDFIRTSAIALDGDGIDADPDDPGDQAPGGSSFHGTHVAGTIASTTNNAVGVSGVTWNTRIMPLRALGRGGGTSYDVMQAVRYATGLPNDAGSVPSPIADIINLSLGGGGYSQSEQDVFTQARNRGVIIVAAAGNASSRSPSYPAAYDGVVSVGAVDTNKSLAWYSNFGDRVDVTAPGGDMGADANLDGFPDGVLSTCGDDDSGRIRFTYCFYQGTSMAAPHMAGVIALMKARNAFLTPNDLDAWLISGAITEDLGPPGRDDRFGYGLIDALEAVGAAAGSVPAVLRINPASLRFGPTNASRTFELKNAGTNDGIIVSSVTANVPWLTVSPAIPPNIGLNPADTVDLVLSVDRNHPRLSSDGIYEAQLVISTDAVNDILTVPVSVQVGTSFVGGNAGTHYVVLVDPETLFTRTQVRVDYNPATMGYAYAFTGVPAGTYQILAGTDSDNDFLIGDPGEAFGAYLTLDQTVSIRVTGNTNGLDFFTSFDFGLSPDRLAAERSNTGRFFMRTQ